MSVPVDAENAHRDPSLSSTALFLAAHAPLSPPHLQPQPDLLLSLRHSPTMTPITSQPYATNAPVVAVYEYSNEKGCSHAQEGHPRESRRCQCNRARASQSRRILAAVLLAALSIVLFALAWGLWDAVFNEGSWLSSFGWGEDGTGSAWSALGGFVKRQANGPAGNGGNTFVDRKCRSSSHKRPGQY